MGHDAWSTHPTDDDRDHSPFPQCNSTRPDYARGRLDDLLQRCALERALQTVMIPDNTSSPDVWEHWRHGKDIQFSAFVQNSGYTCYHPTRKAAEAEQREFLDLLVRSGTTCEPGPLYNQ